MSVCDLGLGQTVNEDAETMYNNSVIKVIDDGMIFSVIHDRNEEI